MLDSLFKSKKEKRVLTIISLLISLFGTLFIWRFWRGGIQALGLNSMIFNFSIVGLFLYIRKERLSIKTLHWLLPICMIILGMGIYYNPFNKLISLFVLPIAFFAFSSYEFRNRLNGNIREYINSSFESLSLLKFSFPRKVFSKLPKKSHLLVQIIVGCLIFGAIASIIIVPLLSSADSNFYELFKAINDFFSDIFTFIIDKLEHVFSASTIFKIFMTFSGFCLISGYIIYWRNELNSAKSKIESSSELMKKYSVSVAIVLVGVLVLYLLFIGIQINSLFLSDLPTAFETTEKLVKTGFWQLFILTVLNILMYMAVYNKSTNKVQHILAAFTVSSLLLVLSATQRVYLYVTNYGLSYEKFYALYTVIFCVLVFAWFLSLFARGNKKVPIFNLLAFASLWMYGISTILPLERIIFSQNLRLTQQSESRININELKKLSIDASFFFEANLKSILAESHKDNRTAEHPIDDFDPSSYWNGWHNERLEDSNHIRFDEKKWYEKSMVELFWNNKMIEIESKRPKIPKG